MGSVACNISKTRICVMGSGVSFRVGCSSRRRGVASSGSRVGWDFREGMRVWVQVRYGSLMNFIVVESDDTQCGAGVIQG